jgi:hypothetical protein
MNIRKVIDGRRQKTAVAPVVEVAPDLNQQAPASVSPAHDMAVQEKKPSSKKASADGASSHYALRETIARSTLVVAAALIVSALLLGWIIGNNDDGPTGYQNIDSKRYQAVFLSNGQVYFGRLSNSGSELVKMTNIWYLQVQQGTQSADALNDSSKSQVSLAKMGNELHGPDDSMSISKDQVLFWENLKDDSKVVKAIKDAQ